MRFRGRLDDVARTAQGIRATARLTRTGIFEYHGPNGEPFDELRPEAEVFDRRSLATLKGAPLTIGHPAEVNAGNWSELSVGHVADDVRRDGIFVTATVLIFDAETCARVESGDLRELSCGYEVDVERAAGDHDGQHYDAIQRRIRYNHVAMGGTDWGRAGRDVRVYADAADEGPVERARREMRERNASAWRR